MCENTHAWWYIYLYLSRVGWKAFDETHEGEAEDLSPRPSDDHFKVCLIWCEHYVIRMELQLSQETDKQTNKNSALGLS